MNLTYLFSMFMVLFCNFTYNIFLWALVGNGLRAYSYCIRLENFGPGCIFYCLYNSGCENIIQYKEILYRNCSHMSDNRTILIVNQHICLCRICHSREESLPLCCWSLSVGLQRFSKVAKEASEILQYLGCNFVKLFPVQILYKKLSVVQWALTVPVWAKCMLF